MADVVGSTFSFWNWLGGMIDGDGYFSISLSRQHSPPSPRICVTPQVGITARADYRWSLEYILKNAGVGRIYTRGKNPYPTCAWQTTSGKDGLYLAKMVFPYLVVKKGKCKRFIEVLEYWIDTANPDKKGDHSRIRAKGQRLRTQEQMLRMLRVACEINADRQTRRYKDKLTYEQWEPLVKQWYPN